MSTIEKKSLLKELHIGKRIAKLPIIQGGMGVGVSRSSLAGAVAKEGGIGVISTAQIGYDEEGFEKDQAGCNLRAIRKHIHKAKELAMGNGLIGVNVMVALKHYKEHVQEAVRSGVDVIICGAGMPVDLPEIVQEVESDNPPALAPIVSSKRAAMLILKSWDRRYQTTADFIVIEGPKAGGHLGFAKEDLKDIQQIDYDKIIQEVIEAKKSYEEKYNKTIPIIVAGGIFDAKDIHHVMELGADGVQIASRFVATYECDASEAYKQEYIHATSDMVRIVQSPVGMPGRALNNAFIKQLDLQNSPIKKCYNCLAACNPKEVPYCITQALINAVNGNEEEGLIFCGSNVDRIDHMMSVHDLMAELAY